MALIQLVNIRSKMFKFWWQCETAVKAVTLPLVSVYHKASKLVGMLYRQFYSRVDTNSLLTIYCHCKKAFVILTIAFVTRVATVD